MPDMLKLYPSGFLGSASVLQTHPMDLVTTAKLLLNKSVVHSVSKYTANEEVVSVWGDLASGLPEFKTFEFKERILKCALRAFGTNTLLEWVATQSTSPELTELHHRWMEETLLYVFTGKRREMSNNNWRVLLSVAGTNTEAKGLSKLTTAIFYGNMPSCQFSAEYRANISIKSFVHLWVQQPGGVVDLMASLNVLFGNR